MRWLAIALLAVGCTSIQPTTTPQAVTTPQVIYITPAPAATPQVVYVTPKPAATPEPAGLGGYEDFIDHQLTWTNDMLTDTQEIADAAASMQVPRLRTAVSDALDTANEIQSWLIANPPDNDCYRPLHRSWSTFIDKQVEGLEQIDYGLLEPITWDDVDHGIGLLEDATTLLDEVTETMGQTHCI